MNFSNKTDQQIFKDANAVQNSKQRHTLQVRGHSIRGRGLQNCWLYIIQSNLRRIPGKKHKQQLIIIIRREMLSSPVSPLLFISCLEANILPESPEGSIRIELHRRWLVSSGVLLLESQWAGSTEWCRVRNEIQFCAKVILFAETTAAANGDAAHVRYDRSPANQTRFWRPSIEHPTFIPDNLYCLGHQAANSLCAK